MSTFIVLWLVSCIIAFVCFVKMAKSEVGWNEEVDCGDIVIFTLLSLLGPISILACGFIWIIEVTARLDFKSSVACKKITKLINKYL